MEDGGKRGVDDCGRRKAMHFVIDKQTKTSGRKRKNRLYQEENKVIDTAVEVESDKAADDCKIVSAFNEASENEVTIRTACRGKHFRRTMSSLSEHKILATYEMRFGTLHQIRCTKLNLPLCQMLVENFDVANSCIKIHGRNLTVTEEDFRRIMGVRGGECDVDFEASTVEHEILALKREIAGKESEITIGGLSRLLVESEFVDDTYKVGFALYALATLLCPVTGAHVDERYLIPLKDPGALSSKNWAKLAFAKLVEGVSSFQALRYGVVGGCILFLQLFYLDVVGKGILLFPRIYTPVMTWGRKEVNRVLEEVEREGGFRCENVRVMKKNIFDTTHQMSGSVDASTGIRTTVVEDLSEVRSDVGTVREEVENLKSTVGRLEPDMGRLRSAILTLETSLGQLKAEGIGHIVAEVIKEVVEDLHKEYTGNEEKNGFVTGQKHEHTEAGLHDGEMWHSKSDIGVLNEDDTIGSQSTDFQNIGQGLFPVVSEISHSDSHLLTYLFSKKVTGEDSVGINEVARCEGWAVSCWDLSCLAPMQCLSSEVVNITAAYLFDRGSDNWFMPTSFSELAKECSSGMQVQGVVPSTIKMCRLRRFVGKFLSCQKVDSCHARRYFFPIHDAELKHWFLAVLNIPNGQCEVWDSKPDMSAYKRLQDYAIACMSVVEKVFANEIRMSPSVYAKFGSFSITYPERSPIHPTSQDSGIFVIRNMQFYRQRWYQGFNSGDQRVPLALEIVNHPRNDMAERVWQAAAEEVPNAVPAEAILSASVNACGVLAVTGMKFNPRRARR